MASEENPYAIPRAVLGSSPAATRTPLFKAWMAILLLWWGYGLVMFVWHMSRTVGLVFGEFPLVLALVQFGLHLICLIALWNLRRIGFHLLVALTVIGVGFTALRMPELVLMPRYILPPLAKLLITAFVLFSGGADSQWRRMR